MSEEEREERVDVALRLMEEEEEVTEYDKEDVELMNGAAEDEALLAIEEEEIGEEEDADADADNGDVAADADDGDVAADDDAADDEDAATDEVGADADEEAPGTALLVWPPPLP